MNEEKLNMPDDVVEAVRKLANENCALAAGQCIVPGGLQGDDGGVQFCNLERRLINQRAKNTTLEYTLNQALAARDSARAKCDEAIGRNTRRENTNQFLLQVCEASAKALAKARQQIDNYAAELAGTRDLLHNASAQIAVKDAALGEKDKVIRALRSERDEARRERDQLYSDVHDMVGAIEERKAPQGGLSLAQARELRDLAKAWCRASLYAAGKNNTVDTIAATEKRKAFYAALTKLTTPAAPPCFTPDEIRLGRENQRLREELENARREMRDRCVAVAERRRKEHEKNAQYWTNPPDRFGAEAARDRCNAREAAVHEVISDMNALGVTA